MESERLLKTWPVETVSAAVVSATGETLVRYGDSGRTYPLASVTKLLTAYAVLIAVEEGAFELDDPAGPPGSTVRHLLAHASGLDVSSFKVLAAPGDRRIYSNTGFETLARTLQERSGIEFGDYLREGVLEPLGMRSTTLAGSPAAGAHSNVDDLIRFAAELQRPQILHPSTLEKATSLVFPGLSGVLPGFGRQQHNDWGLGFEIRDGKEPHWTGRTSSSSTFGHFGQSGTFLWVDPEAGLGCVALTDRDFGAWAAEVWPDFTDAILAEVGDQTAR